MLAHIAPHTATSVAVFLIVYLGMMAGGLPFLKLDRTGIALLGAIALVGTDTLSLTEAWDSIHVPTLMLLFAFMVISAQLRLGGFYTWVTKRVGAQQVGPSALLATLIFVVAGLSAVFSNDIVCLAIAPVLVDVCIARRLNPVPFLLALACSANIGSALTLIGNPQNMLIGETLDLSFSGYVRESAVPVVVSLVATWALIAWRTAGRWDQGIYGFGDGRHRLAENPPVIDKWQSLKGIATAAAVILLFIFSPLPRDVVALTAAGLLMLSRKLHSRKMLGLVDWQLLVLFIGLFVVNRTLQNTGVPQATVDSLRNAGIHLDHPVALFFVTFLLSNVVSNVPAVMLLLPVATHEMAGPLLALASTLAGNLLIVGSIANIIVVDAAERLDVRIGWRDHAMIGIPVTLVTMAIAGAWIALRA